MNQPFRVGVIGLGQRWRRHYRPALPRLPQLFRIEAVCDQWLRRAAEEAKALRCRVAAGPGEMLERSDIDAVVVVDRQWYGSWPVALALRLGKPILCADLRWGDVLDLEQWQEAIRARQLPVLLELSARQAPASQRLRELLATWLGPARLVQCEWLQAAPPHHHRPSVLMEPLWQSLDLQGLDWSLSCFDALPEQVQCVIAPSGNYVSLQLLFAEDRVAEVLMYRQPRRQSRCCLRVLADQGQATAHLPRQLYWEDSEGRHRQVLHRNHKSLIINILEQFYDLRDSGRPPPSFDALRLLAPVVRAARRSWTERRIVSLAEETAATPTGSG
ncbi:MAG: Gfo/Idh/MocA family protein [Gemmataceae bacterium]